MGEETVTACPSCDRGHCGEQCTCSCHASDVMNGDRLEDDIRTVREERPLFTIEGLRAKKAFDRIIEDRRRAYENLSEVQRRSGELLDGYRRLRRILFQRRRFDGNDVAEVVEDNVARRDDDREERMCPSHAESDALWGNLSAAEKSWVLGMRRRSAMWSESVLAATWALDKAVQDALAELDEDNQGGSLAEGIKESADSALGQLLAVWNEIESYG